MLIRPVRTAALNRCSCWRADEPHSAGLRDTRGASVDEHAWPRASLVDIRLPPPAPNVCHHPDGSHQGSTSSRARCGADPRCSFRSIPETRYTAGAVGYVNAFGRPNRCPDRFAAGGGTVALQYRIFFGRRRSMVSTDLTRWEHSAFSCWLIAQRIRWRFHPLPHRLRLPQESPGRPRNKHQTLKGGSSASDLISRSGCRELFGT